MMMMSPSERNYWWHVLGDNRSSRDDMLEVKDEILLGRPAAPVIDWRLEVPPTDLNCPLYLEGRDFVPGSRGSAYVYGE